MRLNTLGGIRVLADGNVVAGAAAQPRRLAVLALLPRAGRAGVTREKILALLWPDEADDRARRTLNQAVYSPRRDIGNDDVLLGSKDLRLNLDLIEVDTVELQDALDAGKLERALADTIEATGALHAHERRDGEVAARARAVSATQSRFSNQRCVARSRRRICT